MLWICMKNKFLNEHYELVLYRYGLLLYEITVFFVFSILVFSNGINASVYFFGGSICLSYFYLNEKQEALQ